jgi:adenosylcobinamide-phosphate synthase
VGFASAMAVAMVVDALLGWPSWLFVRIGHPVTWLGWLISAIDTAWNRPSDPPPFRRAAGLAGALVVIALSVALGWALQSLLPLGSIQIVLVGLLAWPLVALRSLHDHVAAVANPMRAADIAAARDAVSRIVGRDPAALDEAGIARAAIESMHPTASSHRCSGARCSACPAFWATRRSTRWTP